MKIKTDVNPLNEWQAYVDAEGPYGYGKTEQGAIDDLLEKIHEWEESREHR